MTGNLPLWQSISLTQPAAIEASAGTGKTYTVEHLVLRLLQANKKEIIRPELGQLDLKEILLVTFTEKATAELKHRLREKLQEVLTIGKFPLDQSGTLLDPLQRERLEYHLSQVESAPIYTIHSFCQWALKTFAFESELPLDMKVLNDSSLFDSLLLNWFREQSKNTKLKEFWNRWVQDWPKFLEDLKLLCQKSTPSNVNFDKAPTWGFIENKAQELEEIFETENQAKEIIQKNQFLIDQLLGTLEQLPSLNKKELTFFEQIKSLKNSVYTSSEDFLKTLQKFHGRKKGPQAVAKDLFKKNTSEELNDQLEAFVSFLEQIWSVLPSTKYKDKLNGAQKDLRFLFQFWIAEQVNSKWEEKKLDEGYLSFDDMIEWMSAKVEVPEFRKRLQEKFRYAIIDEFQDTDNNQWKVFRSLFLQDRINQNVLYVVGDPKQAIYRFRGADLATYESAKEVIRQYGSIATLPDNYRSHPNVVKDYNALFSNPDWFAPNGTPSQLYTAVSAQKEDDLKTNYSSFTNTLAAVGIDGDKVPEQRKEYAQKATALLLTFLKDNPHLNFGDVAILGQTKKEFEAFQKVFDSLQIPWTIFKGDGLYQGNACHQLLLVLEALVVFPKWKTNPGVSQTDFFKLPLRVETEVDPMLYEAYAKWKGLLTQRRYSQLFDSLQEESNLPEQLNQMDNPDRFLADLDQVQQMLLQKLLIENWSFPKVVKYLRSLYEGVEKLSENESFFAKETESPAIQFLTMHKSKGLEFPIVLHAPRFSPIRMRDSYFVFPSENEVGQFQLEQKNDNNKNREKSLLLDEEARLYYVSLTRAELFQIWPLVPTKGELMWPHNLLQGFECVPIPQMTELSLPVKGEERKLLKQEEWKENVFSSKIPLQVSHSSLAASSSSSHGPHFQEGPAGEKHKPELKAMESSWPSSNKTGNVWHEMLELLPWEDFFAEQPSEAYEDLLKRLSQRESLWTSSEDLQKERAIEFKKLAGSALLTPLSDRRGDVFHLRDIPESHRWAELEFFFGMEDLLDKHGWIQGFIDLTFQSSLGDGSYQYHILDWKSNTLKDYSGAGLNQAMQEHQYDQQANLYLYALHLWLKRTLPNYEPEIHLGGAHYCFLRGVDSNGHTAFWSSYPSVEEITRSIPNEISERVLNYEGK